MRPFRCLCASPELMQESGEVLLHELLMTTHQSVSGPLFKILSFSSNLWYQNLEIKVE